MLCVCYCVGDVSVVCYYVLCVLLWVCFSYGVWFVVFRVYYLLFVVCYCVGRCNVLFIVFMCCAVCDVCLYVL